jgi:hypothetical protein
LALFTVCSWICCCRFCASSVTLVLLSDYFVL